MYMYLYCHPCPASISSSSFFLSLPSFSSSILQCLYNQEQKGIVSALEAVDGLILSCMGQKVQTQRWAGKWTRKTDTDRQTNKWIDEPTDRHTDTQADRLAGQQTERRAN